MKKKKEVKTTKYNCEHCKKGFENNPIVVNGQNYCGAKCSLSYGK